MKALGSVLLAVLGALLLLLVYGIFIEPRFILDTESEVAAIPNLPPEWEGQTIAAVADFQLGMWGDNDGMVRRSIERVIEQRPAAALLLGDYIYQPEQVPTELVRRMVELLRPLAESGIPTYAVLGNHDWALDVEDGTVNPTAARMVEQALDSMGIRVLQNHAIPMERLSGGTAASTPLYLVGIGSRWAHEDRPAAALNEVPSGAPRVIFMHNPNSFPEIPANAAPLAIAAHTHGGQIRVPYTPSTSWLSIVGKDEPHADGWIEPEFGAAGNRLYVNRGIGFSDVPIRINCSPEVTVFTLTRGPAGQVTLQS